jgi:hypothetical protein
MLMFRSMSAYRDKSIGTQYFKTVPQSMTSLLLRGTLPDLAEWVTRVGDEHLGFAALLLLFILFATLTVMNMLVGVLVEVVAMVSQVENESMLICMVRGRMMDMINSLNLDGDGSHSISKDEFEQLLIRPEAAGLIQSVGVDVVGLVEFTEFIFKDGELSFVEFVEMILQLRGSNTARVKDIVDMRKQVMQEFDMVETQMNEVHQSVERIERHLREPRGSPSSPTEGLKGSIGMRMNIQKPDGHQESSELPGMPDLHSEKGRGAA